MDAEQAKKLREPFPAKEVGKLPRLSCPDCSKSTTKVCGKHQKQRCSECGGYLSTAHIHLDYVGHAAVTDRLLQVDPEWSWEPMGVSPEGLPLLTADGLWIRLTVAGVSRLGVGDAAGGKGAKEAIGDALRNAAMRFGVGIDLWSKEDLRVDDGGESNGQPERAVTKRDGQGEAAGTPDLPDEARPPDGQKLVSEAQLKRLRALATGSRVNQLGLTDREFRHVLAMAVGTYPAAYSTKHLPADKAKDAEEWLRAYAKGTRPDMDGNGPDSGAQAAAFELVTTWRGKNPAFAQILDERAPRKEGDQW